MPVHGSGHGGVDDRNRSHTPDLRAEFARVGHELIQAQEALARLILLAGTDPWLEAQEADRQANLRNERDRLLAEWARIALSWRLRGGRVELVMGGTVAPRKPEVEEDPDTEMATEQVPMPMEARSAPTLDISGLGAVGLSNPWTRMLRPREVDLDLLREILAPLQGLPDDFADSAGARAELAMLADVSAPGSTARWLDAPKEVQRALVGHIVARARHVQDELAEGVLLPDMIPNLDRIFSHMTAFSKRWQPGFVFGLMRAHTPVHKTWLADARYWWKELDGHFPAAPVSTPDRTLQDLQAAVEAGAEDDEVTSKALAALEAGIAAEDPRLVKLMQPRPQLLSRHARFKRLRKAIRDAQADDEAFEVELSGPAVALPAEWGGKGLVSGKRVALVGGEPQAEAQDRFGKALGATICDWVSTEGGRNPQALLSAIQHKTVDVVLVLRRFMGVEADRLLVPACKASSLPLVSVDRGYTSLALRQAIERHALGEVAQPL